MNFLTLLKGKLTYAMALLAIVWGLVGLWQGLGDQDASWQAIWAGLVVFGVRRALPQ